MKLPFEQGRAAVRKALGLAENPTTTSTKPFHQNPDGTLMEMADNGRLTPEQQEVIAEENKDLL